MSKKRIILIITFLFVLGGLSWFYFSSKDRGEADALKFKKEYESLNNTIRKSDGEKYNNVNISEENPIKYISCAEAIDIIKNKTGIIYFGANWCPWCRNAIEVLFDSAKKNNLDTIYYLDMDTVKNTWEIQEGKLVKTKEEKEGYYELLSLLDGVLREDNYVLTDNDGNKYDTGEKRIYMPFVVAIKSGHISSSHVGTVSLNDGQTKYDKLTNDQYDELMVTYDKLINSTKSSNSCSNTSECS